MTRAEIPPLEDRGKNATEIIIVGTTLYTAVIPNLDFFENKLKNGCKLKVLFLDPNSQAANTFSLTTKVPNQVANIEQSLKALEELISPNKTTIGKCEVRLSPAYLSFGMAGFDISKEIGFINVQIYSYKPLGEIPNMILRKRNDTKWLKRIPQEFGFKIVGVFDADMRNNPDLSQEKPWSHLFLPGDRAPEHLFMEIANKFHEDFAKNLLRECYLSGQVRLENG